MRKDSAGHPIIDNIDQIDDYLAKRNAAVKKEKLYDMKNNVMHVDHLATASTMVEFINAMPDNVMDHWIKEIMIARIGRPALNGRKMTHLAIAIELGMRESQVKELEKIGVKICNEYLERVTLLEGSLSGQGKSKLIIEKTLNTVNAAHPQT